MKQEVHLRFIVVTTAETQDVTAHPAVTVQWEALKPDMVAMELRAKHVGRENTGV